MMTYQPFTVTRVPDDLDVKVVLAAKTHLHANLPTGSRELAAHRAGAVETHGAGLRTRI
jgi:hypothetical protein